MVKAKILLTFVVMTFAQGVFYEYADYGKDYESSFSGSSNSLFPDYEYYEDYGHYGNNGAWYGDDSNSVKEEDDSGREHLRRPAAVEPPPPFVEWAGLYGEDPNENGSAAIPTLGTDKGDGIGTEEPVVKLKNPGQECLDRGFPPESCCETCIENMISAWAADKCTDMSQCAEQQEQNSSRDGGGSL